MNDEFVRVIVHQLQEPVAIADDRDALPPGQCGREEGRNLNVLALRKAVRDGNRVIRDEVGPVEAVGPFIEEAFQPLIANQLLINLKGQSNNLMLDSSQITNLDT